MNAIETDTTGLPSGLPVLGNQKFQPILSGLEIRAARTAKRSTLGQHSQRSMYRPHVGKKQKAKLAR